MMLTAIGEGGGERMRITRTVYGIVAALIVTSWLTNYGYYMYYRLPEAGFLRHYIETTEVPAVAFDLLYVANKDDKRKPMNVQVDELPELRFNPLQAYQEMRRQTIYILRGYYEESAMTERTAEETLRLHTVKVYYNDGSVKDEDVGEIVVYREPWPKDPSAESPVEMMSVGGSTNQDGYSTVRVTKPVRLTGVSSAWLETLGDALQYELQPDPAAYPLELSEGQMLKLDYRFKLPGQGADAMNVYNVQLREHFEEPNGGEKHDYIVYANAEPHPSEAEMRDYVRGMRRRDE